MGNQGYSSKEMERYFNDPNYRRSLLERGKGVFRRYSAWFVGGGVVFLLLMIWYGFYVIEGLPSLEKLENPRPELATKIYSADGEVLDQFFVKNRSHVSLDVLPQGLVEALIATEDKEFYNHWGVHLVRVAKAMVKNIIALDIREGASTITQQLSRNLYLKPDRHIFDAITRKFRELISSIQIERNFTKREILELYLNVSYFGRGAYGIESAAQTYFGKPARELTMPEFTLLIGMLKGPIYYDPINHPERAFGRRDIVIGQMVKDGILTPEQGEKIRADSLTFKVTEGEFHAGIAPHFVEWVRQQLVRKSEKYGFDILRDGLRVYTTLDARMQRHANRAVEEHLAEFQPKFDSTWDWRLYPDILNENVEKRIRELDAYKKAKTDFQRDSIAHVLRTDQKFIDSVKVLTKTIEVGFVVIDPHTGHIVAMVGGSNFKSFRYGLNHVTQIRRQPGSAFKPFVYTVAIDNGYPVSYELLNQPVTIPMPDGTRWTPQNFDRSVGGKMTLREGFKHSINLIAVRAILEIAPVKQVVSYAKRMGIRSPIPPYESIALGTGVVTPLELTAAYGVYPNEGVYVEPLAILKIEDKDGNVIEENTPAKQEVLSKETAFLMTSLMEDNVNGGTGARVRRYFNLPAAGKTGTTQDYADAWFVGFTPHLAAGVWVGFDDNRIKFGSSDGQGGRAAAPIFGRFMQYVYDDPAIGMALEYFRQPDNIVVDTICVDTKKKVREWCPNRMTEFFNSKYPISQCDLHTSLHWNEGKESPSKISW
ncbi:MAG TPA: PBP1A family penicillin-binding protein [Bacteroidota bacterium]|nr:PBP1A family penicillin-binding protein [Bacteroidota bacterium]